MKAKQGSPTQALSAFIPHALPHHYSTTMSSITTLAKKLTRHSGGGGKKTSAADAGLAFLGALWANQMQRLTLLPLGW